MQRYHPDLSDDEFKCLGRGELPKGAWKYCSNWEDIWKDGFEPVDAQFKKGSIFEPGNKQAKKRKAKERKKTLLYYHCQSL